MARLTPFPVTRYFGVQAKHDLFAQRGQRRYYFGANTNLVTLNINQEVSSYKTSSKTRVTSGEKSYFATTEEQIFALQEPRGRISRTSNPFLPRNIGLNFQTDGLIHLSIQYPCHL